MKRKRFLYIQYLILRPPGIAPHDKEYDRGASFFAYRIIEDEDYANILARKDHCKDAYGLMDSFVIRIFNNDGTWYLPEDLSIKNDKLYILRFEDDEYWEEELSTNVNNIYCFD